MASLWTYQSIRTCCWPIMRSKRAFGFISGQEQELVTEQVENLQIKTTELRNRANSLSGGNQQKVVLAKWLLTAADTPYFR